MYLYRAIDSAGDDSAGDTVEFLFSENCDLLSAKRSTEKPSSALADPDRIVIDGSQTKREAIISCVTETG